MKQQKSQQASWPPEEGKLASPDFLTTRVNKFFDERVKKTWGGGHIMRGLLPGEDAIHISNNDYLSLAAHPDIIDAQVTSLLSQGNGDMKCAIFLNGVNIQREFECRMAEFLQADDVLTTQSGWCANTGLLQSIANEDTPVYIDLMAHMSLWEGVVSAGAMAKPFRHNDMNHLERHIKQHGAGIVVVDSVYSTNGDVCPLEEAVFLAEKYDCMIIVDESHSLGTHGNYGEGMVASMGLADKVHFRTSSLAKAFPGRGGLIACSARHREYFIFESRPAIFSSACLPHDLQGFIAMIDVIKKEGWRRTKLNRNADFLREELRHMGYNVDVSKSQIIALEAGPEQQTIILRDALEKRGIYASVFCAPATPKNRSLMRFSVNAGLSQEQMEYVAKICYEIRDEVDMKNWPSTLRLERERRKASAKNQSTYPKHPTINSRNTGKKLANNVYVLPEKERLKKAKG